MSVIANPKIMSYFNNPDDAHKLFIYKIINSSGDIQTLVESNTNNYLEIELVKESRGLVTDTTFTPQIKVISEANSEIGLKIDTIYAYATNDNLDFLEQTNDVYVFTIAKEFEKNSDIYFLGDNSQKMLHNFNEISDDIAVDDDDNYINLFNLSLQPLSRLQIGSNCVLDFSIKKTKKTKNIIPIEKISYDIPAGSIYQTIQVNADIVNMKNGVVLKDKKIDLMITKNEKNTQAFKLPVAIKFANNYDDLEVDILNIKSDFQFPWIFLESTLLNSPNDFINLESAFLFDDGSGIKDSTKKELIKLLQEMIVTTHLYQTSFEAFESLMKDKDFLEKFNSKFGNKSALDLNTESLIAFETSNAAIVDTKAWNYFKSICVALSNNLASPFAFEAYKDYLWFYLVPELPDGDYKKLGFNSSCIFSGIPDGEIIKLFPKSKYFSWKKENDSIELKPKNDNRFVSKAYFGYMPKILSEIDDKMYLAFIYFRSWVEAKNFMKNVLELKESDKKMNNKGVPWISPEKHSKTEIPEFTDEELISKSPYASKKDIKVLEKNKKWREDISYHCKPGYHMLNNGNCSNGSNYPIAGVPPEKKLEGWYAHYEVVFEWSEQTETPNPFINDVSSYNYTQLVAFILDKTNNNYSESNLADEIFLKLPSPYENWSIQKIKSDAHCSIFDAAKKISIYYIDGTKKEISLKPSFQTKTNINLITKNKYI